jgi:hypothetical protein
MSPPPQLKREWSLLHDLVPRATVIAFLMNPNHPNSNNEMLVAQTSARSIGKEMLVFNASSETVTLIESRHYDTNLRLYNIMTCGTGGLASHDDPFRARRRVRSKRHSPRVRVYLD